MKQFLLIRGAASLFLSGMCLFPPDILAQTPIVFGQTIQDTLRQQGTVNVYTFSGTTSDRITIRLSASWNFSAEVHLHDSLGSSLTSAGSGSGYHARIDTFRLPYTGMYSIRVRDDNGQQTGNYGLFLQNTTNPATNRSIAFGQTLVDTLSQRAQMKVFRIAPSSASRISFRMAADWNFSPQLELYNSTGQLLRRVGGGSGYSVRVDTMQILPGERYYLFVLDNDGQETGTFGVHVQRLIDPDSARPLAMGQTVLDTIRLRSQMVPFTFTATSGDIITTQLSASWNFSPQLELYSPNGALVKRLGGGSGYSARLDTFRLAATGTYCILVLDDDGQQTGAFGFHLRSTTPSEREVLLSYGQTFRDTARMRSEMRGYRFCGGINNVVTIRMPASWNFSPQLELYSPDGMLLRRAGGGSTYTAEISLFSLPTSGIYLILALDDDGQQIGNFTMTIDALIPLPTQTSLVSPVDGSSASGTVQFIWRRSNPTVCWYWLDIADDSLFTVNRRIDSTLTDTTALKSVSAGRHWWRVRARNAMGWGPWSSARRLDILTSIMDVTKAPSQLRLWQNYPNPFNPTTTIIFDIPVSAFVTLRVFDILGQEVATLVRQGMQPGTHTATWNAKGVASGVYLYQLEAAGYVATKHMLLLR